ncbi:MULTISPECIES: hypothetical protein [unclassified Caballeronia]|uniref:hypothetical protein n=1 Tax=unclassified Caballeronia TaxID=2646786 RepID=UPI002027A672|nr:MULTISPECIES: hypothetical protein [unclassified Caballeronia]
MRRMPLGGCIVAGVLASVAMPRVAFAQSVADQVAGVRLGSGYAQLLNLAATPDINSAHFDLSNAGIKPTIDIFRVPYESKLATITPGSDIFWRVSAGYLSNRATLPVDSPSPGAGSIGSKWSAFSLGGGVVLRQKLGYGFTLTPAIDAGLARLINGASYEGSAKPLSSLTDGVLFNWHTNAWLVTPNAGIEWMREQAEQSLSVKAHIAWSWISTFDESPGLEGFRETAGVYSLRVEYARPTSLSVFERKLDWFVRSGYGGFFGANRSALGFSTVAEVGLGLLTPLSAKTQGGTSVKLGVSYLFGPNIRGWSASLGLQY